MDTKLQERPKWMDPETAKAINTPKLKIQRLMKARSKCQKKKDPALIQKCIKYHNMMIAKLKSQVKEQSNVLVDSYLNYLNEILPAVAVAGGVAAIGAASLAVQKGMDRHARKKTIKTVCQKHQGNPEAYKKCVQATKIRMKAHIQATKVKAKAAKRKK